MNIKPLISLFSLFSFSVFAGGSHEHAHGNHAHKSLVGQPVDVHEATETINVTALDSMRFEFDRVFDISPGKTITFVVTNAGKVRHEFSIGNEQEQISHAEAMLINPNRVHDDGEAAITLEAGETKSLTWKFAGDQEVVFACTLPGHYQAGMLYKQVIQN